MNSLILLLNIFEIYKNIIFYKERGFQVNMPSSAYTFSSFVDWCRSDHYRNIITELAS